MAMGFLYYVPGQRGGIGWEELATAGLGHAFAAQTAIASVAARGPDGGEGVVVADDATLPNARRVGYYPDAQEWIDGGYYWVGVYREARPGPLELARPRAIAGSWLRLRDGNEWLVPIARQWTETDGEMDWRCPLPGRAKFHRGSWQREGISERYAPLWEAACRWWDTLRAGIARQGEESEEAAELIVNFDGLMEAATTALAVNYRIGEAECGLLDLLDETEAAEVMNVTVDWGTMREWLKKKALSGSPVIDG